jgi:hypothetical protein
MVSHPFHKVREKDGAPARQPLFENHARSGRFTVGVWNLKVFNESPR